MAERFEGLERVPVIQLQPGDVDISYGKVVHIKHGVVRWTITYDSGAVMRRRPEFQLYVKLQPAESRS